MKHSARQPLLLRILPVAVLAALLVSVPETWAQHAASRGHSGGFSSGHVGGFSGGGAHRGFSAPPSFRGFAGPSSRSFSAAPRIAPQIAPRIGWSAPRYSFAARPEAFDAHRSPYSFGDHHDRHDRDYRGRYREPYRGYGYGGYPYAYVNSWVLLPSDLDDSDIAGYADDNDTTQPNNVQVQPADEEQEQPPQPGAGYWPEYAPPSYQPLAHPQVASSLPTDQPELTLIFKDGHTMAIRNYLLTSGDVIVMDNAASGREPRIPLSELNLPATERAAQQGGLDFSPPSS